MPLVWLVNMKIRLYRFSFIAGEIHLFHLTAFQWSWWRQFSIFKDLSCRCELHVPLCLFFPLDFTTTFFKSFLTDLGRPWAQRQWHRVLWWQWSNRCLWNWKQGIDISVGLILWNKSKFIKQAVICAATVGLDKQTPQCLIFTGVLSWRCYQSESAGCFSNDWWRWNWLESHCNQRWWPWGKGLQQ